MKWILYAFIGVAILVSLIGFNQSSQAQSNCDPAYPDICLAPPPPDLDCKDVPYQNFRVLSPDPHHFDSDLDGIGCEA